jgi:uridine phosphorylase
MPLFTGNPAVQLAVQNGTDKMEYVDNYITPELIEIVVNQTNLYAQRQIATMPRPVTKHARSEQWKTDNVLNEEMSSSVVSYRCNSKTKIIIVLVNKSHFTNTHFFTNDV